MFWDRIYCTFHWMGVSSLMLYYHWMGLFVCRTSFRNFLKWYVTTTMSTVDFVTSLVPWQRSSPYPEPQARLQPNWNAPRRAWSPVWLAGMQVECTETHWLLAGLSAKQHIINLATSGSHAVFAMNLVRAGKWRILIPCSTEAHKITCHTTQWYDIRDTFSHGVEMQCDNETTVLQ